MQRYLNQYCSASDCALRGMERWLQQLGELGRKVVPSRERPSETIGVLSHRPIVLAMANTIDYRIFLTLIILILMATCG